MTVLVLGGGGQLGRAVARLPGVRALPRADLDVTDAVAVADALDLHAPRAVIDAAAYTAVDQAERDRLAAFAVNATGAAVVARACAARGVRCLYVSTDHVFDGPAGSPRAEDDPVAPANVYGASKAAGERAVRAAGGIVVRTSWLFADDGWGFVPAIARAALAGRPLRVVADRVGRPTYAGDLAQALMALVDAPPATYHYAGAEVVSWHQLACAIVEALGRPVPIEAIPAAAWPHAAPRPTHGGLATGALAALGLTPPSWRPGLARVVAALASAALPP
ncbi:MAG: dTDP-4-dehydrorhamnose reductase [Kofleriaceae bacterium]